MPSLREIFERKKKIENKGSVNEKMQQGGLMKLSEDADGKNYAKSFEAVDAQTKRLQERAPAETEAPVATKKEKKEEKSTVPTMESEADEEKERSKKRKMVESLSSKSKWNE